MSETPTSYEPSPDLNKSGGGGTARREWIAKSGRTRITVDFDEGGYNLMMWMPMEEQPGYWSWRKTIWLTRDAVRTLFGEEALSRLENGTHGR